jgi:cardiolipin synthase A/B
MSDVSGVPLPPEREGAPVAVPTARDRLRYVRALLPRIRWQRRVVGVLFFAPLIYAGAQTWHRFTDAFGTTAIQVLRPLGQDSIPAVDSPQFRSVLAALTQTSMESGHRIDLLIDGPATMKRLDEDMRRAEHTIEVQNYYCEPGNVTDWFKTLVTERARAGVKVYFLRDGFGCESLTRGWLDSLREVGVEVATLRPVRWWAMHESMHRSHVRIVTIDGRIGYVGGFGLADKWIDRDGEPRWRETAVRFTGPAVTQLAGAFAIGWVNATGHLITSAHISGEGPTANDSGSAAGVMFTQRAYGTPVPERFLALSLAGARKRVYIANSYFVPNRELRAWLVAAARRGVDVRVLAPSEKIDIPFTHWAGRSTYAELMRGGVRIYEYQPAMMHAKTMLIDETFVSVGSLNLDNLSLRINEEAVLQAQDRALADAMEVQFARDLEQSTEITLATLEQRSLYERAMTLLARLVRDLL